ncbi:MAG: hypothetical protein FWG03_10990, partial [Clostridiales bacterium]|nr:hypothetical protein [Clostridiales bacterium]
MQTMIFMAYLLIVKNIPAGAFCHCTATQSKAKEKTKGEDNGDGGRFETTEKAIPRIKVFRAQRETFLPPFLPLSLPSSLPSSLPPTRLAVARNAAVKWHFFAVDGAFFADSGCF